MTTDVAADLIAPVQAYMDALKAQDIERVLGLFTEDGSLMANEAPTAVGGEQLRATFTHFFTMLQLDRDLHVDECFAEGSIGFVRSHTTGSMTIRATKTRMELEFSGAVRAAALGRQLADPLLHVQCARGRGIGLAP